MLDVVVPVLINSMPSPKFTVAHEKHEPLFASLHCHALLQHTQLERQLRVSFLQGIKEGKEVRLIRFNKHANLVGKFASIKKFISHNFLGLVNKFRSYEEVGEEAELFI